MVEELENALRNISDSYEDFVNGSLASVKGNEKYQKKLLQYLKDNSELQTDDVIDYIYDSVVA